MEFKRAEGELIGSRLPDKPMGLSPYALGQYLGYGVTPSEVFTVAPSQTVTTAATVDWSQAGIFQYQLTTAQAFAPTFSNAVPGQSIIIVMKQPASSTDSTLSTSNMGTITFAGAANTLSTTNSYVDVLFVTCISSGTYIANLVLHWA
ncbi:MAG TPA: hypothetical protein VKF17_16820 [Isosphaeraceae bacterium]|nr:hypothetical protein [Isosphaeraceae bacterium]